MTLQAGTAPQPGDDARSGGPQRPTGRLPSVLGVLGEVLLTLGVLAGLYVVWQLWVNDAVSDSGQAATAHSYSEQWESGQREPSGGSTQHPSPDEPALASVPGSGDVFANLIVPRFGEDYIRPIAEGVDLDVLNDPRRGMGHYEDTQLPGALGNFAVAAHRSAYGGALHLIHELRLGDRVYVETEDGWYRYVYRNTEYVLASGVGVLAPVPQRADAEPGEGILTMTTCNPFYSSDERIIAYAVLDSFRPRSEGPPGEIANVVGAGGEN